MSFDINNERCETCFLRREYKHLSLFIMMKFTVPINQVGTICLVS